MTEKGCVGSKNCEQRRIKDLNMESPQTEVRLRTARYRVMETKNDVEQHSIETVAISINKSCTSYEGDD